MQLLNSIKKNPYLSKFFLLKNIPFVVLFIAVYVTFFGLFFATLQYSRLSPILYFLGFIVVLFLILFLSLAMYDGVIESNSKIKWIGAAGLLILTLFFAVGDYVLLRVNSSINEVIVDPTQMTSFDVALVAYDSTSIKELKDISGKKLGILSNTDDYDRNSYVKSEIEDNSININYVEYLSYNDLLLALFNKEVDVAALPSDYYNQFEINDGYIAFLDKTSIIHQFTVEQENTNTASEIDVSTTPFTVLIMGNDGGRSDSIILATYNPVRLEVTMTSVPRDSYIPIACYPNQQKDKLGHAFAVSQECAMDTVENLFGVNIDYYVTVNFQGVVEIVDALGGIPINSPVEFIGQNSSDERGHYTVWIPQGYYWADGESALAFARERHAMPGGDYQRQENQQSVIEAIVNETLQLNDVNKALAVLDAAGSNIKTNMPLSQMIELFNGILKSMNRTGVTSNYILDIIGSRVMGYSSYTYNEPMQLPLWISVPYKGSIEDNRNLMLSNLNEPEELPSKIYAKFNAASVFYAPDYFALTYNEKEVHEVLPDFMPNMSYNDWTYEKVKEWASSRGISLTVDKIKEGNALYNAGLPMNYIVGQSVRYGVKTSSFSSLTLKVIKHNLDCTISDNMVYDECKYKLPDFVGQTAKVVDVVKWAQNNNVTLKTITILENDPTYDKTKIGLVIKQTPTEAEDFRSITDLTITIMDSNYSVTIPTTTGWTQQVALDWVKANLLYETNYVINSVPTMDSTLIGKVSSTVPASGNTMKIANSLTINVYVEGWTMGNYVGIAKSEVDAISSKFAAVNFTNVNTTDASLVGKIASQDIASGTLKSITDWKLVSANFGVYVLQAATPTTPTTPTTPSQ